MTGKRPLIWLSADTYDNNALSSLSRQWHPFQFRFDAPIPILTPEVSEARVGVLDLTHLSSGALPRLNQWLERLTPDYWIGLTSQRPASGTPIAQLITRYCTDFHTLPVDNDRLSMELGHLWGMANIACPSHGHRSNDYHALVLQGNSEAIRKTRSLLRRLSAFDEPVLIVGESGTGRESAARFIHQHSQRASGPFVVVNCAALPPSLTQSELFGYEKGAFTHAFQGHAGRLEQASRGTLLLASIDELQLAQQSAMLRFLQESRIERIGGDRSIFVDSRLIATAGQPLQDLVQQGHFRSDVFYRLGGLEVRLPALRQRQEDIPSLSEALLDNLQATGQHKRLSEAALHHLMSHPWPGNVRELQNRLRQALLLGDKNQIGPEDLGFPAFPEGHEEPDVMTLESFRATADRQALSCSLALTHHNVSAAARLLNISRVSFYRLLEKYNAIELTRRRQHNEASP